MINDKPTVQCRPEPLVVWYARPKLDEAAEPKAGVAGLHFETDSSRRRRDRRSMGGAGPGAAINNRRAADPRPPWSAGAGQNRQYLRWCAIPALKGRAVSRGQPKTAPVCVFRRGCSVAGQKRFDLPPYSSHSRRSELLPFLAGCVLVCFRACTKTRMRATRRLCHSCMHETRKQRCSKKRIFSVIRCSHAIG